jgi:Protein of unknown function (DUF3631)
MIAPYPTGEKTNNGAGVPSPRFSAISGSSRTATEERKVFGAEGESVVALRKLLLGDIREAFVKRGNAPIPSAELVEAPVAIEGRPWAELGKSRKPLTQNGLARMLKPLGIGPDKIGPETKRLNGYKRDRFKGVFARLLPPQGASASRCFCQHIPKVPPRYRERQR